MGLLDLLLPSACAACGRYGSPLCSGCLSRFRPASQAERRFMAPDPGVVIGEALDVAVAAFAYEGTLRRVLQRLKYGGAARLAGPLAVAALPALRQLASLVGPAPLVPVPVHRDRLHERGYNQAALLAHALSQRAGLPVADLLQRERSTVKQHQLDRAGRLRNLRAAFSSVPGTRAPAAVILVDDILTTSATLEACAMVLRAGGVRRVCGLAIAREV